MLKYSQPKMFHVGNIPTMDQEQFGEFWNCLSIFKNSTKLQKNRKRKITERLTWRLLTGPPAGPAQRRSSELLAGQADRQVPDGDRSARHAPARRRAPACLPSRAKQLAGAAAGRGRQVGRLVGAR